MKLNCIICGKEFTRAGKQALVAKTCSFKCLGEYNRAKPNTICTECGKEFHMKQSSKEKYKRTNGYFCSKECFYTYKTKAFRGKMNHQYGLTGSKNSSFKGMFITHKNNKLLEIMSYCPNHPYCDKNGRVTFHRLIVELNYMLFNPKYFDFINNYIVLKKSMIVHHIDCNHDNNDISNLQILIKGEHTSIHNKLRKDIKRDDMGRFIKNITN